jgi:hypothetical protein
MLNIKNIEILKNLRLNDWRIAHIYENYTNDIGKEYYIFQLDRTGGIASTTISLEKIASYGAVDINTMGKRNLYELKGPAGTMNLYLTEIKSLAAFINKMREVC